MAAVMGERRATWAAVARLAEGLSERDWAILADVARVRVLTGRQVERLHFADLVGMHRDRWRRRVLEHLTDLGLLSTLERRIGGVRAGSAGLVFTLAPAGQRLYALRADTYDQRFRKPVTPTDRFMIHNLLISELYVGLREADRRGRLSLVDYKAESSCWWRDGDGEWVKPDALAVVGAGEVEDSWAIEVDNATESVPTLRRKLLTYVDLAKNGDHGPNGGLLPRVLLTVPDDRRLRAAQQIMRSLPEPAEELVVTTVHSGAIQEIARVLRE